MATIAKRPISPQIMYALPVAAFSSSPPAVMYVMTPQRKTTVAKIIRIGINELRIVFPVSRIVVISAANASIGTIASVVRAIPAKVFLFMFIICLNSDASVGAPTLCRD